MSVTSLQDPKRQRRAKRQRMDATAEAVAAREEEDPPAMLPDEQREEDAAAEAEQPNPDEQAAIQDEQIRAWAASFIGELEIEATDRVSKKLTVEAGWIEDLRQYYAKYEPTEAKEMQDEGKSTVFVAKTRAKTDACEARISDMLFPTDEKNYSINRTEVPQLTEEGKRAAKAVLDLAQQATEAQQQANTAAAAGDPSAIGLMEQGHALQAQGQAEADKIKQVAAEVEEADKRAVAMGKEIEDQLTECRYPIEMRDVIRDGCRIGTGISKGPIGSSQRARRAWKKTSETDDKGAAIYELQFTADPRPAFKRVDPWSLFPDPDARRPRDSEDWYERHLLKPKGIRALARQPGYDKDAIRELLVDGPAGEAPMYLQQIRTITGENPAISGKVFVVWEYRGTLELDAMRRLCKATAHISPENAQLGSLYEGDDVDPLNEINVVIVFCQGKVLKFGIHHLDSQDPIYSFFNLEEDDASVWGFGVPRMMRDSQAAINGAWRMVMDNGGRSVSPQVVVCRSKVDPEDGDWTIRQTGPKVWITKAGVLPTEKVFEIHEFQSHLSDLLPVIEQANKFIDEETNVSVLAQGEQGAHTTQTSGGMALLMNAVNVVFRRFIRNFDDNITIPNLTRAYDWNMQFNPKDEIKGDFEVKARGSTVLLVREIQTQNLANLVSMGANPMVAGLLKQPALVRKLVQSMMIEADEIVKTDEQIQKEAEAQAAAGPQVPPMEETKRMIAAQANDRALKVAYIAQETAMMGYAAQHNMTLSQAQAELERVREQIQSKERMMAGEIGAEALASERAAARGVEAKGSGGFVSA